MAHPAKEQSGPKLATMNSAQLHGEDHPEMQELLQRNAVFMTGHLYGQKNRRNTQDGGWQRVELSWLNWFKGAGKSKSVSETWGLSRHPENKRKEGSCFVPADAYDGSRGEKAIHTVYALVIDVDGTASLDDTLDRLEGGNLFAVVSTSFRHMTRQLELNHDTIVKKIQPDGPLTTEHVRDYLRDYHKDRYSDAIIGAAELIEARYKGQTTLVKVPPIEKFRIIVPLFEPVVLADLGATMQEYKDAYADAVCGFAVDTLGIDYDGASGRINQAYFNPRHPKDAEDWYAAVVQGRPLRFDEITPRDHRSYAKNRGATDDPFSSVGSDTNTRQREQYEVESGFNLNRWHTKYKDRWNAADVIESFCSDKIREAGGEKPGTCHLACPFEHEHSSEGGTATMALNPDENEMGYWSVFCRHDACNGRDKLEFVKAMVDEEWFPESVLTDDEWCIPLADEDYLSTVPDVDPLPLSAPLWEDGLVTDGFCKRKKAPEVRQQIRANLRSRVSHVIVEGGKSKVFIHPKRGQMPEVWDDTALNKFYRNNHVFYDRKESDKPGEINPADEFFGDDLRVTYAGTQFEPDPTNADPHKFNTFNGFPIVPTSAGDWSLLRNHIRENLIAGNGATPEEDEYLFNYLMTFHADIFQNPGHKKGSSIAILGEQGVGKSKFFDWYRMGLGGYATKVSNKRHLVGNFNNHLDSKLLVVAEEAFWSGDKEAAGVLKDFITSETYMAERKNFDAVERPNYIRTEFITNNEWAIPTDDNADARRFLVLRAGNAKKQNGAYFAAIDKQMRNGGLEAMVHEFMTWDPTLVSMSFDDLRSAPWTAARAEQASHSASAPKATLLQIVEDGFVTDRDGMDVELSDSKPTRVRRADLAHQLQGKAQHGGARKAVRKAIEQVLGECAWHENKHEFGGKSRERYVEFPPLSELREELKGTYR